MPQYGLEKDSKGVYTSPETLQRVIDALYVNADKYPMLKGGVVTGRGDMALNVSAGVGICKTADGAHYVVWDDVQTNLIQGHSTVASYEVYADKDGAVYVCKQGSRPSNTCLIDRGMLPSNVTTTATWSSQLNRHYAMPYGAGYGTLANIWNNLNGAVANNYDWQMTFQLETDRRIRFEMVQQIWSNVYDTTPNTQDTNPYFGSMGYTVQLDNNLPYFFELEFNRIRQARYHTIDFENVAAGTHTLYIFQKRQWDNNCTPYHFSSVMEGDNARFQNAYFRVVDNGVMQ